MTVKNEFTVNKQTMLSWVKRYSFEGKRKKLLFAMYLIMIGLGGRLLSYWIFGGDVLYGLIGAAAIFLAVYRLFFMRFVIMSRQYDFFAKTYGLSEWQRTIEFTDDEVILTDHTSVTRFRYENMQKIVEAGNTVRIIMNHNAVLLFYKDTFVVGSWQECKSMLESKMK